MARADDPLKPSVLHPGDADLTTGGNRYDSAQWGTLYFASTLHGCFAETLARFRPSTAVLARIGQDPDWRARGFMPPGAVPADWRHRRVAVRAGIDRSDRFLDLMASETHVALSKALANELSALGCDSLDNGVVQGRNRQITRALAQWAHEAVDDSGHWSFAGVRYLSRLGSYECWAVFDRTSLVTREQRLITTAHEELNQIASLFELTVY